MVNEHWGGGKFYEEDENLSMPPPLVENLPRRAVFIRIASIAASRTRNGMPVNEAKESQSCVAFSLSRARAARWLNYSSVAIDIARELRCAASETTVP